MSQRPIVNRESLGPDEIKVTTVEHKRVNIAYRVVQFASLITDIFLYALLAFFISIVSTKFAYFIGAIIVSRRGLGWRPGGDALSLYWDLISLLGSFPMEKALATLVAIIAIIAILSIGRRGMLPVRTRLAMLLGCTVTVVGLSFLLPLLVAILLKVVSPFDDINRAILYVLSLPVIVMSRAFDLLRPLFSLLPQVSDTGLQLVTSVAMLAIILSCFSTLLLFCVSIWNRAALGATALTRARRAFRPRISGIALWEIAKIIVKPMILIIFASVLISFFPLLVSLISSALSVGILFVISLVVGLDQISDLRLGIIMTQFPSITASTVIIISLICIFRSAGLRELSYRNGFYLCSLPWIPFIFLVAFPDYFQLVAPVDLLGFILLSPVFLTIWLLAMIWGTCVVAIILRFLRRFSIEQQRRNVLKSDSWLFLRSFGLDASWVKWPFDLLRFLPIVGKRRERLEHIIADCVIKFGPLRAVGNPTDPDGDHGIAKEFLSDDAWQPFVFSALNNAQGIIFLFGAGKHISWELERIIEFGAVGRTIFVTPPQLVDVQTFLQSSDEVFTSLGVPKSLLELVRNGRCICFYFTSSGWNAILNRGRSAFDYRIAIHKSLSDLSLDNDLGRAVRSPV